MKAPLFHVGQAVVCLHDSWCLANAEDIIAPKKGRVYIIELVEWDEDAWYLGFAEIPNDWCEENGFAPVQYMSDEALAELLEEVFTPVTA